MNVTSYKDAFMKKAILDILSEAIRRETKAFNYYAKARKSASSPETESLLIQLAEEERKHRYFLRREIQRIEKLLGDGADGAFNGRQEIHYSVPEELPFQRLPFIPGIDLAAVSLPTELLGGDNFDTILLGGTDGRSGLGLFLFDVMGHGMDSMRLKASTKEVFGKFREDWGRGKSEVNFNHPSDVIDRFNRTMVEQCQSTHLFITAFYGVLNPPERTLTYSSAGHEPPVLIRATEKFFSIEETDLLVGADEHVDYSDYTVPLYPGDVIVLFSDGLTEAGSIDEALFEKHSVCRAVRRSREKSSRSIVEAIFKDLKVFLKGIPLTDDCTVAVMKLVEPDGKKS